MIFEEKKILKKIDTFLTGEDLLKLKNLNKKSRKAIQNDLKLENKILDWTVKKQQLIIKDAQKEIGKILELNSDSRNRIEILEETEKNEEEQKIEINEDPEEILKQRFLNEMLYPDFFYYERIKIFKNLQDMPKNYFNQRIKGLQEKQEDSVQNQKIIEPERNKTQKLSDFI